MGVGGEEPDWPWVLSGDEETGFEEASEEGEEAGSQEGLEEGERGWNEAGGERVVELLDANDRLCTSIVFKARGEAAHQAANNCSETLATGQGGGQGLASWVDHEWAGGDGGHGFGGGEKEGVRGDVGRCGEERGWALLRIAAGVAAVAVRSCVRLLAHGCSCVRLLAPARFVLVVAVPVHARVGFSRGRPGGNGGAGGLLAHARLGGGRGGNVWLCGCVAACVMHYPHSILGMCVSPTCIVIRPNTEEG